MVQWLVPELLSQVALPVDVTSAQYRIMQDGAFRMALALLDSLLGHVPHGVLTVRVDSCSWQPGQTSFLNVGGGMVVLTGTAAGRWYWSALPHPERYFLPLAPQTLLVRWPKLLWLTRSADPCWIRLLCWSGQDAVVLPVVIPGDKFRVLVVEMMRIRLGVASHDGATRALHRARLTGGIRKAGTARTRRLSVCMAGCECRRFRAALEKPAAARPLPRHLWSGFLRRVAREAAAQTATLGAEEARRLDPK